MIVSYNIISAYSKIEILRVKAKILVYHYLFVDHPNSTQLTFMGYFLGDFEKNLSDT